MRIQAPTTPSYGATGAAGWNNVGFSPQPQQGLQSMVDMVWNNGTSGFGTAYPAYAGGYAGGFPGFGGYPNIGNGGIDASNGGAYGSNIVNVAQMVGNGGWKFTGNALGTLKGGSANWQQQSSGGMAYLQIKPGANPAEAIRELFDEPNKFEFDCATSTAAVLQMARLQTVGDDAFNSLYMNNPLILAGWTDTSGTEFSMSRNARFVGAGDVTLNGNRSLDGELAPFDAAAGDQLLPGGVYYFEKPGDTTTYNQGWNAIYLGQNGDNYLFWRVEDGIHAVNLRENNQGLLIDTGGMYKNEYLSASVLAPQPIGGGGGYGYGGYYA